MYKIYIKDKPFFILNQNLPLAENYIKSTGNEPLGYFIDLHSRAEVAGSYCVAPNALIAFNAFKKSTKVIRAGGGLVKNKAGAFLFIFRKGKWDLPKGKLDKSEKIADCALREVREECGISPITLGEHWCNTYHVFDYKGKYCLKETHWYHMTYTGKKAPKPQLEEDITAVEWLNVSEMDKVKANTFGLIKAMVEELVG